MPVVPECGARRTRTESRSAEFLRSRSLFIWNDAACERGARLASATPRVRATVMPVERGTWKSAVASRSDRCSSSVLSRISVHDLRSEALRAAITNKTDDTLSGVKAQRNGLWPMPRASKQRPARNTCRMQAEALAGHVLHRFSGMRISSHSRFSPSPGIMAVRELPAVRDAEHAAPLHVARWQIQLFAARTRTANTDDLSSCRGRRGSSSLLLRVATVAARYHDARPAHAELRRTRLAPACVVQLSLPGLLPARASIPRGRDFEEKSTRAAAIHGSAYPAASCRGRSVTVLAPTW